MPGAAYSTSFKSKMVEQLVRPGGASAYALGREHGVPQVTLSRWKRKALTLDGMGKPGRKKQSWSVEDRLRIILRASELKDEELGAFLRAEGLHAAQLEEWRASVHAAFGQQAPEAKRQAEVAKQRIRELEADLARKEKALAEGAALLWLKKKAAEIWGEEDDSTRPRSAR
jgi:transposase-like protein